MDTLILDLPPRDQHLSCDGAPWVRLTEHGARNYAL